MFDKLAARREMNENSAYAWLWWGNNHYERFRRYVESRKLVCQECGGGGGETVPILDYGQGPWEECGWCEGTGYVTPWLRGQWLRYQREKKLEVLNNRTTEGIL